MLWEEAIMSSSLTRGERIDRLQNRGGRYNQRMFRGLEICMVRHNQDEMEGVCA